MPKIPERFLALGLVFLAAALALAVAVLWFRVLGWGEGLVILAVVLAVIFSFRRGFR
ncbi:MAG: hypothetical protein IT317_06295 [Anaerolineales bacterium]|nr:hypothetical protein [Anaerolineales bacterium]